MRRTSAEVDLEAALKSDEKWKYLSSGEADHQPTCALCTRGQRLNRTVKCKRCVLQAVGTPGDGDCIKEYFIWYDMYLQYGFNHTKTIAAAKEVRKLIRVVVRKLRAKVRREKKR
jgi:hypothetical protein